jgi:hypothetical protein
VSGSGNLNNPYVVDAFPMSLIVQDSDTVNLSLTGAGTTGSPWVITGALVGSPPARWGMWSGTQAAYDALGTWDSGTLYMILEP